MAEEQTQKVTQVLDSIKTFTVLELVELVKAFEDEFGVTAAAPAAEAERTNGAAHAGWPCALSSAATCR